MTVVGFTGFAQSGKDTAASFLVEKGFTRLAFADILRTSLYALNPILDVYDGEFDSAVTRVQDVVDAIGWDRAKVEWPEIRQLLQRFGTEVGRDLYGENFWVERVTSQIRYGLDYVITDVRFPNEEKAVHDLGGLIFRINRHGVGAANAHASENIDVLKVDGVIPNLSSRSVFRQAVLEAAGLK